MKIVGGSATISDKLVALLPHNVLRTNTKVKAVKQEVDGNVVVSTKDGHFNVS